MRATDGFMEWFIGKRLRASLKKQLPLTGNFPSPIWKVLLAASAGLLLFRQGEFFFPAGILAAFSRGNGLPGDKNEGMSELERHRSEINRLNQILEEMAAKLAASEEARRQAEEHLHSHIGDEAALQVSTGIYSASLEMPEILSSLKSGLSTTMEIPAGVAFLWDDAGAWLVPGVSWGLPDTIVKRLRPFTPTFTPYSQVLETKQTILVTGFPKSEPYPQPMQPDPILEWQGHLILPIACKGILEGILDLFKPAREDFDPKLIEQLAYIANQVGVKVQNAHLYEQIRVGRRRSQSLSQQVLDAQEAERRHISRELHDQIGGALTALKVNLQSISQMTSDPKEGSLLADSIAVIDRTLTQVRSLSLDLRPSILDDLGVVATIRWYVDRQAQAAGLEVHFKADPPDMKLDTELATTCFRVVQEAVTNVVRHAQAHRVWIDLSEQEGQIRLTIRDDGIGFNVPEARERLASDTSLGLLGMSERVQYLGGTIQIRSDPETGAGTLIEVVIPLHRGRGSPEM
jgi:signal transduction histidine kinase